MEFVYEDDVGNVFCDECVNWMEDIRVCVDGDEVGECVVVYEVGIVLVYDGGCDNVVDYGY